MTARPGQIALRKFDHDEAVARHAAGEAVSALAREYGVSLTAVYRVVDPRVRERMYAQSQKSLERRRMPCKGGCGVLVWPHGARTTGYCNSCYGDKLREKTGPQHGTEVEYTYWKCRCVSCTAASRDARARRRAAEKAKR